MDKEKNSALKCAGIYIAVILGAGFASGQEIISYFIRFGLPGFVGLFIAACVFGVTGFAVFSICIRRRTDSYKDFMEVIAGKKLGAVLEVILTAFMFILFATMLAAAGATMKEAFFLPYFSGVAIAVVMCFIAFLFGMEGIIKINAFLAPFMIFGSVFIALYILISESAAVFSTSQVALGLKENFVISAFIYVSYNVITAVTVLSTMRNKVGTVKIAVKSGFIAGALIFALGISVGLPLYLNYESVKSLEIPILVLVQKHSSAIEYFYLLVMTAAVFSTAATNGYAVVSWVKGKVGSDSIFIKIGVCILGVALSFAGFSNFVGTVYPVFALAGFFEVLLIIKAFMFSCKK